jgi:uncharacterized protein
MSEAKLLINKLKLIPHPEGGFFNEIYRSEKIIKKSSLPDQFNGDRNYSTSIYYLLEGEHISFFHKLISDELWHFYKGSPLILHCLSCGIYLKIRIGNNIERNESFQYLIQANTWFAAEVEDKKSYTLVGCTVAPGFDYSDFELAKRKSLLTEFPQFEEIILKFTKE